MDWDTTTGRFVITGIVVVGAYLITALAGRAVRRIVDDPSQGYNARRLLRIAIGTVTLIGLVFVWRPLGGELGPALGLATAGLAFAMQEVIGAIAGWFNITFGRVFRVGDRVQMADVHGDVIDISLLKTRLMEIGGPEGGTWVRGRQHTGRVVAISNKASFTQPVFNYSSYFDYIWDEFEVAIPHHGRWAEATDILEAEAARISASEGARAAMAEVRRRFPVPATDVEPRVFVRTDEDYVRLSVRFVVPIRNARALEDTLNRRVHQRLEEAGIEVVGTTVVQEAAEPWEPIDPA
ncbi:MAG: mechanosensitive ion channel [Acidimicrobiia bacterium]|nr:mechanosensitive ion channel [Acidimicrobiia bacterium]